MVVQFSFWNVNTIPVKGREPLDQTTETVNLHRRVCITNVIFNRMVLLKLQYR